MAIKTFFITIIGFLTLTSAAKAASTEERFQDIFITAGYATAIGAGLGAASLSFYDHPEEHLKHVAIGASLGFIGGTILGSYVVMAPGLAINTDGQFQSASLAFSAKIP